MNRKERRSKNKGINILKEIITIINQYFPELIEKFDKLTDVRNQSYVKYQMKVIFIVRLMPLMCEIKSMNELTREFNTEEAIENIAKISGLELEEIPHCDTINDVFKNIKVEEIEKIIKYMITKLIRSKMLEKYKIRGKYYHVVVDGTGLATSRKKYNNNCLVKNKTDKNGNEYKEYSTYVLEAKLIVGDMVFSIGSEFVENTEENITKQDCEIKAFKRLAKRIKKEYPRLKILIGADALYAKKTIMDICKENEWKYIIRFKEGTIPTLYKEFKSIVEKENESNKNIENTINVGRKRWKIENEGFNMQKNGTFDIGHLNSKNATAIKVHYLIIQIAHTIRQMLEKGSREIKKLKLKIKEISQILKTTLISTTQNLEVHNKIQLRFD